MCEAGRCGREWQGRTACRNEYFPEWREAAKRVWVGGALPTPVHDGYARSELKALNHDAAVTTGKRHNGSLAAAVAGLVNRILKVVGHRINGSIIKLKVGRRRR